MNAKIWAPLAMAIVLGMMAALVARNALLRSRAAAEAAAKTTTIAVAAGPIQPGQELTREHLTTAAIAATAVPPGAFASPDQIVGRVSVVPIVAGQTILDQFLAPKGAGSGLQALVPPGMRAITIDTNESSGLAGMLIPGCRVDVVATAVATDNPDKSLSRTIVQDLQVVAVGQRLSGPKVENEKDPLSRTVTLLASPHDAQAIDLALATERLRLVLRGSGDTAEDDDDGVLMAELRGGNAPIVMPAVLPQNPQPPAPPTQPTTQPAPDDQPKRVVVRLIEGNQEHQVIFKDASAEANKDSAVTDTKDMQQNAIPQPDPFGD